MSSLKKKRFVIQYKPVYKKEPTLELQHLSDPTLLTAQRTLCGLDVKEPGLPKRQFLRAHSVKNLNVADCARCLDLERQRLADDYGIKDWGAR